MNISYYLAQDIVEQMKDIINQEINYFDSKGYIIASTDKNRIGRFHGGAKKVLESKKELVIEYDNQYVGAKKGINLPVYFNDEVVGVVGITGDKKEVLQYGRIIERITNILIKDEYIRAEKKREVESKKQFIEDLLFSHNINNSSLEMWGNILGLDFSLKRQVIIIRLVNKDKRDEVLIQDIGKSVYRHVENIINKNSENLIIKSGTNIIVIYQLLNRDDIYKLANNIIVEAKQLYNDLDLYIGIGGQVTCLEDIKSSYREAKKALDIGYSIGDKKISEYSKLDLGLLIEGIDKDIAEEYYNKVLNNLTDEEIEEYSRLLYIYIKHNGSINKASEELFIHKNTLQYRLNKLNKLTEYNPREIRGAIVLYLSFLLKKYNEKN